MHSFTCRYDSTLATWPCLFYIEDAPLRYTKHIAKPVSYTAKCIVCVCVCIYIYIYIYIYSLNAQSFGSFGAIVESHMHREH